MLYGAPQLRTTLWPQVPYGGSFHQELLFVGTAEGALASRLCVSAQVAGRNHLLCFYSPLYGTNKVLQWLCMHMLHETLAVARRSCLTSGYSESADS